MRLHLPIIYAVLLPILFGCGKKDSHDAAPAPWTPVLGTCTAERGKTCFLSDQTSGMIWSETYKMPLSQNEASTRCRTLNMRLPTFREYAVAAKNGMLDIAQAFPAFGDVESLLWTSEPQTYIAFGNNTAVKRQGSAPARFKCVTGDVLPSSTPRTNSEPAVTAPTASASHANQCGTLRSLEQCGTNHLCVWTYRGCMGIEGILENPRS